MKRLIPKRPKMLIVTLSVVALLILSHLIALFITPFIYLNLSPSQPIGIYLRQPFDGHLVVGDLVLLDVPAKAQPYVYDRRWMRRGTLLLKNVGALPGAEYRIKNSTFFIRGKRVGPIFSRDSQGLPLPYKRGRFIVRDGHFLPVATRIDHSFDGRYFGDVPQRLVRGRARVVMVLGK